MCLFRKGSCLRPSIKLPFCSTATADGDLLKTYANQLYMAIRRNMVNENLRLSRWRGVANRNGTRIEKCHGPLDSPRPAASFDLQPPVIKTESCIRSQRWNNRLIPQLISYYALMTRGWCCCMLITATNECCGRPTYLWMDCTEMGHRIKNKTVPVNLKRVNLGNK